MSPLAMNRLETLSDVQVEQFREEGFLAVENVLPMTAVEQLRSRFEPLFAGDFDTGVYPDEWYWREELSKPDVTRHMANAWKADLTIAALSLSQDLGKAACRLTGWPSAKLGQDTIWWKPPGGKPIAYHQDTSFMDFLDPQETITFWFALDDVTRQTGTLEYARGSHKWPCTPMPSSFHAAGDYRGQLRAAAHAANAPMPVSRLAAPPPAMLPMRPPWVGKTISTSASKPTRATSDKAIRTGTREAEADRRSIQTAKLMSSSGTNQRPAPNHGASTSRSASARAPRPGRARPTAKMTPVTAKASESSVRSAERDASGLRRV